VTNFGALAILALPRKSGPGEAAETRLLIALEAATRTVNEHGDRRATLAFVAERAGLPEITARRARDRCVARSVLSYTPGKRRGHVATWRLLFSIADQSGDHLTERQVIGLGDQLTGRQVISQGDQLDEIGDQSGDHLNDRQVITSTSIADHPGRSLELSTTELKGSVGAEVDRERARDDDAQPDWRRGPGRAVEPTKVYAPGHGPPGPRSNPRPTRMPPPWAAPNRPALAPERVAALAADAKRALADRPRPEGAPPSPPQTDDERRTEARRQVREAASRRRRAAAVTAEPAEPEPAEPEPAEPEPAEPEPEHDEGPPDEIPF
jgi:hypothetical protein